MITREHIVHRMNNQYNLQQMFAFVKDYIKDRKGVDYNGGITERNLITAYDCAVEYYAKKFHVNILYSKETNGRRYPLKIF